MALKATLTSLRAVASTVADRVVGSTVAQRVIAAYELGQFLLFKGIVETPLLTDAEVKAFFKNLTEAPTVSDLPSLRPGKVESDAAGFSDDDTLQFGKVPSDTTLFVDAQALDVSKLLTDSPAVSEALAKGIATLYGDASNVAESHSKAISKDIYEFYALDYFQEDYVRSPTEVSFDDAFSQFLSKALGDSTGITDDDTLSIAKLIQDGVTATDDFDGEATTEDDQEIHFVKVLSHSIANTDAVIVSLSKNITESPGVTDAGNARGQGYSDFDYFAEDYVGYSWTF